VIGILPQTFKPARWTVFSPEVCGLPAQRAYESIANNFATEKKQNRWPSRRGRALDVNIAVSTPAMTRSGSGTER